jgi:hypothetical protein
MCQTAALYSFSLSNFSSYRMLKNDFTIILDLEDQQEIYGVPPGNVDQLNFHRKMIVDSKYF